MKRIAIIFILLSACSANYGQDQPKDSFDVLSPVEVRAVRANANAPFTKTNLLKKDIAKMNVGQDIPFLLNQTPSVVINADAGNGIGYTGIRIRGTDATRINVTLNGIPYNDAESQGTYFVDLPDFSSSVGSIQIQRGVGTSSNGAGAFGASINFSTNEVNKEAYAEINNSFGSFNSWKNTVRVGTGLVDDHFTTDIRISRISSDGYIDRAKTNLKSFYFSTAYLADKTSIRLNIFSGKEKTYQAWNGISEADLLAGHRRINYAGTEKPGAPYDNQTDNYWQDHYQLFFDQKISNKLTFNTALFLVKGRGYYEEYKAAQLYADYLLPDTGSTDLIRQLWLDNSFYGDVFSLQSKTDRTNIVLGGGYTVYKGSHFGTLIWAQRGLPEPNYRWYDLDARKADLNIYLKQQTHFSPSWFWFYDLQYHHVKYNIDGFEDNPGLVIDKNYDFFNPKAGITYHKKGWKAFISYSLGNKEPNRDDFEASQTQQPKREMLHDVEMSLEKTWQRASCSATFYYMYYLDQLVLTGKINDVGAYTRTNIPKSYRLGVELEGAVRPRSWINMSGNVAVSQNKVLDFTEYLDDYDAGGQKINKYHKTDIAFSPRVVGAGTISFLPRHDFEVSFLSKYVSKEFLDNTQNEQRKLKPFYTEDLRVIYTFKTRWLKEIDLTGQLNNLFNRKYEPNGYTFSYISGGETVTENYYFPMAGTNFMIALSVKL